MQTELAREQMVHQQVRAWDVLDERVLEVLARVRRECFVPEAWRELAFADTAIALPRAQHMLQPSVVGRILQALELTSTDVVLEIGTGSGFLSACLAAQARSVRTLEIFADLADFARGNLAATGVPNAIVECGDGTQLEELGRYDAIALTASLPLYDKRFERALKPGGRLFVIVGEPPVMDARLVRRVGANTWSEQSLFETVVDPLINAAHRERFVF
jgi:protein-L-isoaspartate(D-aspartate) O-methyltransferase